MIRIKIRRPGDSQIVQREPWMGVVLVIALFFLERGSVPGCVEDAVDADGEQYPGLVACGVCAVRLAGVFER
jgi:hypothetical protein